MSFSYPTTVTPTAALLLLMIVTFLPSPINTQPNLPQTPTFAECGPRIIPLAMCAPFVQGVSSSPSQSCCDNLKHVNDQQPLCLCLLLNNSALSATFPVNATLAMQLPLICDVHFDIVSCTGEPRASMSPTPQVSLGSPTPQVSLGSPTPQVSLGSPTPQVSLGSPTPQVSLGSPTNSTVASASPMMTAIPKTGYVGYEFQPNYAMKIRGSLQLRMMVLTILTSISSSMLY